MTNKYLWCGTEICEQRDSAGSSVTKQFFPQGVRDSSTNYFYNRDHLGSIREVVANDGSTIAARYDYDPYGRRSKISGSYDADFGYTGHFTLKPSWMDEEIDLTFYRPYFPNFARWGSRDPIGEMRNMPNGLNLYDYVGNDPIYWRDPWGLYELPSGWDQFVNFGAGGADALSWGLTKNLRDSLGDTTVIDPESDSYKRGQFYIPLEVLLLSGYFGSKNTCPPKDRRPPNVDDGYDDGQGPYGKKLEPWGDSYGRPKPDWKPPPGRSDRPDDLPGPGDPDWTGL